VGVGANGVWGGQFFLWCVARGRKWAGLRTEGSAEEKGTEGGEGGVVCGEESGRSLGRRVWCWCVCGLE
jgi:hypothetical protein